MSDRQDQSGRWLDGEGGIATTPIPRDADLHPAPLVGPGDYDPLDRLQSPRGQSRPDSASGRGRFLQPHGTAHRSPIH